jgi:hypothetical protein
MNTIFDFDQTIEADLRTSIEEKINQDIELEELKPCHGDLIRVLVRRADHPLNVGIEVNVLCACGNILNHGGDQMMPRPSVDEDTVSNRLLAPLPRIVPFGSRRRYQLSIPQCRDKNVFTF